jgi:hypothetical protein
MEGRRRDAADDSTGPEDGKASAADVADIADSELAQELAEDLVSIDAAEPLGADKHIMETARGYAEDSKAANTRRAYRADWQTFEAWCAARGLVALPAGGDTVALYFADRAASGLKASSIGRLLTAIVQAHLGASHASPRSAAVKAVLQGIRRRHGAAPAQKAPLLIEELWRMVEPLGDRPIDVRDRALLLLGFCRWSPI